MKNNIGSGNNKSIQEFEKEFERIMNDYSLDYAEKEKEIRRYTKVFMSK